MIKLPRLMMTRCDVISGRQTFVWGKSDCEYEQVPSGTSKGSGKAIWQFSCKKGFEFLQEQTYEKGLQACCVYLFLQVSVGAFGHRRSYWFMAT